MALVISDLHGNYLKCKTFIEYKSNEEHIILGDFMDSYSAPTYEIIDTLKLAVANNCTLTVGNHELPYLNNAHNYFRCSGNRNDPELFYYVNTYKNLFHGSLIRDGYLLVHGGLSTKHARPFNTIEEANAWINEEWEWYRDQVVVPTTLSKIFDIGSLRGGRQDISGVFWCSIGYEKMTPKFNQIVGHTNRPEPIKLEVGTKSNRHYHIGVDSPKLYCYNTQTHEFEDFCPEEYTKDYQTRKLIERRY